MPSFKIPLAATVLMLLACGGSEPRAPETPLFGAAFNNLPLPPAARLVSRSGSNDALQLTLRTPAELPQVTQFYRNALSQGNWRLVSDSKNRDGSLVLYAEQKGPPLWVRLWKPAGASGSMVQLTGAVVAKHPAASTRPDTSSKKKR
jgi:hypothetical protein